MLSAGADPAPAQQSGRCRVVRSTSTMFPARDGVSECTRKGTVGVLLQAVGSVVAEGLVGPPTAFTVTLARTPPKYRASSHHTFLRESALLATSAFEGFTSP